MQLPPKGILLKLVSAAISSEFKILRESFEIDPESWFLSAFSRITLLSRFPFIRYGRLLAKKTGKVRYDIKYPL